MDAVSERRVWRTSPKAARVPVGNVYYFFKTKEELAEAVVARRLRRVSRRPGGVEPLEFSEGAAVSFRR